jgi:hypothetical protein
VNVLQGSPDCERDFQPTSDSTPHWHTQPWLFDVALCDDGFITSSTKIVMPDIVTTSTKKLVAQFHNMDAQFLTKTFPECKIILLNFEPSQLNYILHRWWKVIGIRIRNVQHDRIKQISLAYDVLTYNYAFYQNNPVNTAGNNTLSINFDQTVPNIDQIAKFLEITLVQEHVDIYSSFIKKQMSQFYNIDDNFLFACKAIEKLGTNAPIITLANQYSTTQEFLDSLW